MVHSQEVGVLVALPVKFTAVPAQTVLTLEVAVATGSKLDGPISKVFAITWSPVVPPLLLTLYRFEFRF